MIPELSVVVPFYNPGEHLQRTLEELVTVLRSGQIKFEVIAVDDGSTDGSGESVRGLASEIRVITLPKNRGKGAALRMGFGEARGTYIAMLDADGDIDPRFILEYLRIAQSGRHDVVVASRSHPDSRSAATPIRKMMSATFSGAVEKVFRVEAQDTQVGCKLFHQSVLAEVLPMMKEDGFAFDLELFVILGRAGIGPIYEAPVEIRHRLAGSTIGPAATLKTIKDSAKIFGRLYLTSAYEFPQRRRS